MQNYAKLYEAIVALILLILGSGALFGYFINRWVKATDSGIKELYERTNDLCIEVIKLGSICNERHSKDKK